MASNQRQAFRMCVFLSKQVGIHTFFVLPVWERSMHSQRRRAEIVTRAVERLSIDWPAEREVVRSKSRLD